MGGGGISSVQSSSDDEEQELDTTAEQRAAGKDIQGIPWERLHFTREQYRVRLLPRLGHPRATSFSEFSSCATLQFSSMPSGKAALFDGAVTRRVW